MTRALNPPASSNVATVLRYVWGTTHSNGGPGDVWEVSGYSDPLSFNEHRVPQREQGDILRTVFTHAERQLVIRTRFAELAREGKVVELLATLRTDTGAIR
jgi:hypothetical protein